ncbi:MAG: hypothetical protein CME32_09785 [Gimesia sp.]|nr:hypothetical protein [Gimesia sp.]
MTKCIDSIFLRGFAQQKVLKKARYFELIAAAVTSCSLRSDRIAFDPTLLFYGGGILLVPFVVCSCLFSARRADTWVGPYDC